MLAVFMLFLTCRFLGRQRGGRLALTQAERAAANVCVL